MVTSKPSKQRKRFYNAPHHRRRRMLSARLSDDLTKNHRVRRLPVRSGDSVRVMRGDFAGLEGKVQRVDYSNGRIFVEGMAREKSAGVSSQLPVHVTKVRITNLNLSDKWRSGLLAERGKSREE
ncbi:MAG TPA: 50S ribosomal protein L24 [Candidatus Bathyarchaeia archaeon]|nr:50S ribosomal protein L24 [Candidatus Bathyarchaeia archaeon]